MSRTYRREPLTIEDVEAEYPASGQTVVSLATLAYGYRETQRLALAEALQAFVDGPLYSRSSFREALESGAVVILDELDVRQ
jgi:hypothetical protein